MKKSISIIFFLFVIFECYSQKREDWNNLVGTWKYFVGFFECTLKLNADSTYEYSVQGDLINNYSEGRWSYCKSNLILNSTKQKPEATSVISDFKDSIKGTKLIIKDNYGLPVGMPRIEIVADQITIDTLITNYNGVFDFLNLNKIQKLKVSFIGLNSATWSGDNEQNYFEITMTPEYDDYIYQTNEKWKVKNSRLYDPNRKNDNKIYKKKNRIDYFIKSKN